MTAAVITAGVIAAAAAAFTVTLIVLDLRHARREHAAAHAGQPLGRIDAHLDRQLGKLRARVLRTARPDGTAPIPPAGAVPLGTAADLETGGAPTAEIDTRDIDTICLPATCACHEGLTLTAADGIPRIPPHIGAQLSRQEAGL